jgi:DNA-binding SARP family transcriptional activator
MGTKIVGGFHEKSAYSKSNDDNNKWVLHCINNCDYSSLIYWLEGIKIYDWDQEVELALEAALQLCAACRSYQHELDAARDHYQRTVEQEKILSGILIELMTALLSSGSILPKRTEAAAGEERERPLLPTRHTSSTAHPIWQRLQTLLGRTAEPLSGVKSGAVISAEEPKVTEDILDETGQPAETKPAEAKRPLLEIYCFNGFQIYINGQSVDVWTGNKGKLILKYMLLNPTPIPREVLMETFWPGEDPETTRKNLYQAIYVLRQSLQTADNRHKYIITHNGSYLLDPNLEIWIDSHAFQTHLKKGQAFVDSGQFESAIREYEAAIALYQGEFLPEDLYEDWLLLYREDLKNKYLDTINWLCRHYFHQEQYTFCINYARKIISQDHCREDAHRLLMRAYHKLGQRHLALKQYHQCLEYLAEELAVSPMPATQALYETITQQ